MAFFISLLNARSEKNYEACWRNHIANGGGHYCQWWIADNFRALSARTPGVHKI
jgi:hypothetical protein